MTDPALTQLASFLRVDPVALAKELHRDTEEKLVTPSIYWKPTTTAGINIDVGGSPSAFIDNLKKVFGNFPVVLDGDDIPKLETLASLFDVEDDHQPFEDLIQAVQNAGSIEVWAVY